MTSNVIVKTKGYSFAENQVRFAYVLATVLKEFNETGKFNHKTSYYRILIYLRKKLKIPGRTCEKIPSDHKNKFPLIPDWAFYKKTRQEKIKMYQKYIETADLKAGTKT